MCDNCRAQFYMNTTGNVEDSKIKSSNYLLFNESVNESDEREIG